MKVKVAAVQPESFWGEEEYKNAERCLAYLDQAARAGAQVICFPEGYPGPSHGPLDSGGRLLEPPVEMVRRRAKELAVYVTASHVEENPNIPGTYYLCQKLVSPEGEIIADHRRVQPDEPDLNEYLFNGKRDFVPGDDVTVVDTEVGKIGLLICSELWVPELARMEMLLGAEIIISPVNGNHTRRPWVAQDTWHCIARARAAENLCYVIITQNMFMPDAKGGGCIAGPDWMLAQQYEPGIMTADLDMDRLRYLRGDSFTWDYLRPTLPPMLAPAVGCRPGQQKLRRPEIYQRLLEPRSDGFDYWYFLKEKTARSTPEPVKERVAQRNPARP